MSTESVPSTDEERLAQLGYQQELHRRLSGFSNFAVSFSIISILAGAITSYGIAMTAGGPVAITLGWLFVGIMVTFVALAMAEVCSAYPTAGALYWWAAALAKKNKPAWAWFVGWFNFLGEVAVTAAIDFGAAITTAAFFSLTFDMTVTPGKTFLIFLVIIIVHGLLNTFGVSLVRLLSDVSAWWHLVGVAVIVVVLAVVPDKHKPFSEVFFEVHNATGFTFAGAGVYAVLLGLLMAQYTYTGYDASAHVAEETHDAANAAPRGIVSSVVVSVIAGFILLVAITWSIQDYDKELASDLKLPPAQIFIDAAGHNLTVSLPDESIALDADPVRLTQVLVNLLNNAVKFTPSGGHIWLIAETSGDGLSGPDELRVRIRDSGVGIKEELLPKIFEMFMQGDVSLERTRAGLGVGLTLVKNLVGLHGGTVEARSNGLGSGSEFTVRLPIDPKAQPERRREYTAAELRPAKPLRILVADDNEDGREMLGFLLRAEGHSVEVAADGPAAIDAAASFHPEVIVLDIGMPGMNGYSVARTLRQKPWASRPTLIALSGLGQQEDKARATEAGFDRHFTKPVDVTDLLAYLAGRAEGRPERPDRPD